MTDKAKKSIDSEFEFDDLEIVPLILPDDFDTPRDLDERIIREMAELSKELDEKNKQHAERKAHTIRFFIRTVATAAVLALIVFAFPLRNYVVSASDDVKSWINDISSEKNTKMQNTKSEYNSDKTFENLYIVSDKDFKGGIAHGDTLCIIPNNGEKDSVPIIDKYRLVTNTGEEKGRDYFHVSITDSNRIIISVTNKVQRHAHLEVRITYEDGSVYENEWDLITSRPLIRFNPHYIKGYVGESFVPKYYVVVLDEHDNLKTVNYLKGTNRILWSTTDETIATVDEKGTITGLSSGYATIHADIGYGNVGILSIKIAEKNN